MTCNQLSVLLDIHRGTFRESRHMGTVAQDLMYLLRRGLITLGDGQRSVCTIDGSRMVDRILKMCDPDACHTCGRDPRILVDRVLTCGCGHTRDQHDERGCGECGCSGFEPEG